MIFRLGGLALAAVVLSGCPVPQIRSGATVTSTSLPEKVPDLIKYADELYAKPDVTAPEMENALLALDKATKADPKSFEAQWKAARATVWLADESDED
ncbi:MAG: hypothetical protein ACXVCV_08290, partial [Polyangia bacterium]